MLDLIDTLDYSSWSFGAFVVVCVLASRIASDERRAALVLAFNVVFLANLLSGPVLAVYALLALGIWAAGRAIGNSAEPRPVLFYASVAALIALFLFLRAPVAREWADSVAGEGQTLVTRIGVVYGYSYFMFKSINYLVASYVGTARRHGLLDYLNFMFFFSSFTAGPIARYVDHQDGVFHRRAELDETFEGLQRILNGLIKKYVFVDLIASFSLVAFDSPYELRSVAAGWAATWAHLLYIYVDFSAYTDIAIGIGLLFGYRLPENFQYPLLKQNLVRFWESWHMSLTQWIREHVFTPLTWKSLQAGGLASGAIATLGIYLLTMTIFGLWHSLTLPFLVFGIVHGVGLFATQRLIALRRAYLSAEANRRIETHPLCRAVGVFGVNLYVALSLILFRFDMAESAALLQYLFSGTLP